MSLESKDADVFLRYLQQAAGRGENYVVYELDENLGLRLDKLETFKDLHSALDYLDDRYGKSYLPGGEEAAVFYLPINELIEQIKLANPEFTKENTIKDYAMNKMNLENLQGEMRSLKFDEKTIELMEKEMAKGQPGFQLRTPVVSDKGQMEAILNFKKSTSSDYYFLNRYDLAWSKAKPLEEGRHYFVISPNPQKQNEHLSRKFDSAIQAMDYFKAQQGSSELAIGKTAADKMTLATMTGGKVDYVTKEFRGAFYATLMTNSVFVDKGRGFTVEQASNMFQGRSVFRDDMLNISNQQYSSWNRYLFEEPKDRFGNYKIRQYNENYGFDLKKDVEGYKIKELDDPKKIEQIMDAMKNGNRPLVTVTGEDGKEQKLRIEAMPRYGNFNFYQLNGDTVKREQFQKNPALSQSKSQQQVWEKKQHQQQTKGMAI